MDTLIDKNIVPDDGEDPVVWFKYLLKEILRIWPSRDQEFSADARRELEKYLSSDFDQRDFFNDRLGNIRNEPKVQLKNENIFLEFEDGRGYKQRAVFELKTGLLKEMKFQCPICFGSGEDEDQICKMCEGVGWGAGKRRR